MLKRSITGLILGIIMIGSLIYSQWTAILLLSVILIFSSVEWNTHFNRSAGWLKSGIFYLSVLLILLLMISVLPGMGLGVPMKNLYIFNSLLIGILIVFSYDMLAKKDWAFCRSWYSGLFYIGLPVLLASYFLNEHFTEHRLLLLGFIIINWSNDVFAYFTGRAFGKRPLAADISPKKTLEGAIGGLLAAIIASWLINEYMFITSFPVSKALILGLGIGIAGTLGDLYESKMKRIAGIKDSGNILPGHGGFLDRFDSFFYIIPAGIFILNF